MFLPPLSAFSLYFFTLLFAAQKPLLLLLIGLKENAVPLETYGHSGENKIEKKREQNLEQIGVLLGDQSTGPRALCRMGAVWVSPTLSAAPALSLRSAWISFLALSQWKVTKGADFIRRRRVNLGETLIYQTLLKRPEVNAKVTFP